MSTIHGSAWPLRVGFGAWFGAGAWFGLFGAGALFAKLGDAGAAAPLAALFPTLFWFGVGSGVLALGGALIAGRVARWRLRLAAAGVITVGALCLALVLNGWVQRSIPGSPAFAMAHGVTVGVASVTWLAALIGLLT